MKNSTILVLVNLMMAFFLFVSSQYVLVALNGKIVQGFGLFVDFSFPYQGPLEWTPTGVGAPLPNYPLYVFLLMVVVNLAYFLIVRFKSKPS
ncbi:MAG: hypothetical protein NWE92_13530 [Candidatus Bathyarchaeota archaeon]|nr:hypothetical protein [Candidatus Bathyarchaeota archaeon]